LNFEGEEMVDYDLGDRLLDFAANVVEFIEALPNTRTGNHIANQLLRSGTAPLAHHAEAQAAESRRDFVHKMRLALKELRETSRWLDLAKRRSFDCTTHLLGKLLVENDELNRIFNSSIQTALRSLNAER
jgi:four helix bundle protein